MVSWLPRLMVSTAWPPEPCWSWNSTSGSSTLTWLHSVTCVRSYVSRWVQRFSCSICATSSAPTIWPLISFIHSVSFFVWFQVFLFHGKIQVLLPKEICCEFYICLKKWECGLQGWRSRINPWFRHTSYFKRRNCCSHLAVSIIGQLLTHIIILTKIGQLICLWYIISAKQHHIKERIHSAKSICMYLHSKASFTIVKLKH